METSMWVWDTTGDNAKKAILLGKFPEKWKILNLEMFNDSKDFQIHWAKILEHTEIDLIGSFYF